MFPSFSVFIGECSLDILALKSSTVFPSVEAGVVTELPDIDFMREIADLFLRAAKLFCMSADPQLLSEEHVQEQEELDDSTPFATEPDRSGVATSAFGTIRLLAGTRRCCLVMSFISCRRSDASLASLSAPSPRSSIRMMFIDSHQSRVPPTLKTRKTRSNRTFQASYERAFPSRT